MLADSLVESLPDVVMPACPIRKVLKGQKVLVTGGNSGIGKGIAMALGHAGADVVINYRSGEDAARQVADEVARCGSRVMIHQADVSQEEQVQAMSQCNDLVRIEAIVKLAGTLNTSNIFDPDHHAVRLAP